MEKNCYDSKLLPSPMETAGGEAWSWKRSVSCCHIKDPQPPLLALFQKKVYMIIFEGKKQAKTRQKKGKQWDKISLHCKRNQNGPECFKKKTHSFWSNSQKKKVQNHQFWSRSINFPVKTIKLCLDMVQRWEKRQLFDMKKKLFPQPSITFFINFKTHTHTHIFSWLVLNELPTV